MVSSRRKVEMAMVDSLSRARLLVRMVVAVVCCI